MKVETIPRQAKPQWKKSEICQLENYYPEEELKGTDLCLTRELWGCIEHDSKIMGFFSQNNILLICKRSFKETINWLNYLFLKSFEKPSRNLSPSLFIEGGRCFYSLVMQMELSRTVWEHTHCGDSIWTLCKIKKIVLSSWFGRSLQSDLTQ